MFYCGHLEPLHAVEGRGSEGDATSEPRLSRAAVVMIRYACQQGLLNTNQIGNVRPDIPPSQNNCVEQTEWTKLTVHCFHEEGGGDPKLVELEHLPS